MKNYKTYYLLGIIFAAIAITGLVVFITLPMADPGMNNIFRWVCLGIDGGFLILLFFSGYLVKKGTFLKNNQIQDNFMDETETMLRDLLDKKYQELENSKKDENEEK